MNENRNEIEEVKSIKEQKEPKGVGRMFKEAGILFAITLIAGLLLGFVHELTKEPIARKQQQKVEEACREVFDGASGFEEIVAEDAFSKEEADAYAKENGVRFGAMYRALAEDGETAGYVLTVTSTSGYGGDIEIMMGVQAGGMLTGITILSISETPGLGMRAKEVLVPQFAGKNVSTFVYTKNGALADSEIDAISGATITTSAVTDAVNAGLYYFKTVLQGGGNHR